MRCESSSKNYIAYDNLGNALVEHGNIGRCPRALREGASEVRPNYAEAHDDLGIALVQKGSLDKAIVDYLRRRWRFAPHYPEACIDLGEALVEKGRLDDAVTAYKKALDIRPGYADAHYNLGLVYTQKGGDYLAQAVAEFKKAVDIRPYYAEAHFNLGIALADSRAGLRGPAGSDFPPIRWRSTLHPNYPRGRLLRLGLAYFQNGDTDNAMTSSWRKALAIRPNYEEAHYYLGHALSPTKAELDEAIEQYNKALEIGPQLPTGRSTTTSAP